MLPSPSAYHHRVWTPEFFQIESFERFFSLTSEAGEFVSSRWSDDSNVDRRAACAAVLVDLTVRVDSAPKQRLEKTLQH